ncbi:DUF1292 domain-containing protein [Salsuginibacillus kocurii]|uniref:DUF1292 domain-containing protein n=1 Tax=Salsuginibacillus kocurii TaxID=427078 RepID=UPI000361A587|nr:DUF1292 domain-containing protein [Salsuginibacillus kocurii]
MSEEEKERIIIPDEDGVEHLFDILFTFEVDETESAYMVVVPVEQNEETEDGEVDVFAFRFEENEEEDVSLYPIEDDKEWEMVEEMIETFTAENEEEE